MSYIAVLFINLFKQLFGSGGRAYVVPTESTLETFALCFDEAVFAITDSGPAHSGTGYNVGDVGHILGGTTLAAYEILSVSGPGGVRTFTLTDPGKGYTVADNVATTTGTGGGFGFTVDILEVSGLGTSECLVRDGNLLLDSCLPDNNNFTDGTINPADNDCNDWERRTGLKQYGATNTAVTPTTAQRKIAIAQKMRYPGTVSPRQAADYLQNSLQAAGFPVYVYGNYSNQTPAEVLGVPTGRAYYGNFDYGELDYGEDWGIEDVTIISNSVDPAIDNDFVVPPGNYRGTFFIGGSSLGTFASIPAIQETQFRQLVLNLKPAHLAAYTFILFT